MKTPIEQAYEVLEEALIWISDNCANDVYSRDDLNREACEAMMKAHKILKGSHEVR